MSEDNENISGYVFLKDIGEGNFGKVKLGINKTTGEEVAIKIMNKEKIKTQMGKTFIPEIEISKQFNHQNVIHVYKILEDDTNYYIIMEYCSKGELFDYIVLKKKLSKEEASIFFYQLINGVEHIHSRGYAHRDLKPENLLLTNNNILKIIDFGLTHEFNDDLLLKTKCGSPSYAAPEILKGTKYDGFKSDIWCCGIILYAMLSGFLPFEGKNNKILFKNIIKCELKLNHFDDDEIIKNLIKNLLNPDPKLRINLNDIKTNEFYLKGKILFQKMENKYKYHFSHSTDKKYFKIKNNNIRTEINSKRQNKNNKYSIFENLSTDRIKKINFNRINDNSLNKDSKINNDKKSLDIRILQTSKNAEEIIFRHTHKNERLKINPYLKIIQKAKKEKNDFILKFNLNEKIKKLLKKNNSEEDTDEKMENLKKNILPNFRKINNNLKINTNEHCSEINIKTENNKIIDGNDKQKEFASISKLSKIDDIDERYKSLNNKNILNTNNRHNKLIFIYIFIFNFKGD